MVTAPNVSETFGDLQDKRFQFTRGYIPRKTFTNNNTNKTRENKLKTNIIFKFQKCPILTEYGASSTTLHASLVLEVVMALLTNPSAGNGKLTKLLINKGTYISIFMYVAGILWFLSLAHKFCNNGTYFSENALLPGLVQAEFNEEVIAKKLFIELHEVMKKNPTEIPFKWLLQKFSEFHIDAYLHNFTLTYPLVNNITYKGQNIYGILRGPRSSGSEGLIITAPFRTLDSIYPDNSASVALILALAKYCRRHKYWAKDIIFLFTDHEQLGTQAWLQAYHNVQLGNGVLDYGNIIARSGSIQAAVNLEFHSISISHIDVKIEGLNGQLPNLDLFNLVYKLSKNEGIRQTFKNRSVPRKKDSFLQQWYHSFMTLILMVLTQSSCVPNGNHGLYHRFGIEAVTLEGYSLKTSNQKQFSSLYNIGRVLEGILRSLNNLLEKFHQSYFFYLLTSNDRFIPIGSYMYCIGFIGSPLLIKGLTIWLKLYNQFKPKLEVKKHTNFSKEELLLNESKIKKVTIIKIFKIGISLLLSCFMGWLYMNSGLWLSKTGLDLYGFSSKHSVYLGFFIIFCCSLNVIFLFKFNETELYFLNIIGLLMLATLLLILAMHNFSLSLILVIIYVPCICMISSKFNWKKKLGNSLYMLLIHPFIFMHVSVLLYTCITHGYDNLIQKAFSATQYSYIYLLIDEMIYGNWFIKTIFGFLTPCWMVFWICLHS